MRGLVEAHNGDFVQAIHYLTIIATGVLVVVKDYLKFCHADTKVRENPLRRRNPERG